MKRLPYIHMSMPGIKPDMVRLQKVIKFQEFYAIYK